MRDRSRTRNLVMLTSVVFGTMSILSILNRHIRQEMQKRGYPSWDICHCNFKTQRTVFLVCHSQHEQRGETIVSQEWGIPLNDPPEWLRYLLHVGAQVGAILNPSGHYVERVTITPQEAQHFAVLLRSVLTNEGKEAKETNETSEEVSQTGSPDASYLIWRREVLHVPRYAFDPYTCRLYPVQVSQERSTQVQPLPALWDVTSKLPLPGGEPLLETPIGTRIDYIGWTPSQISYCTMRSH
jgi:hypothetical protein